MKTFLTWLTGEKILSIGMLALGIVAACHEEWQTAGLVIAGGFAILKGDKNEKADTGAGGTPDS